MKHDFAILTAYAAQHDLTITDAQYAQLDAYLTMLQEWNEKLNLTAITDPVQMVSKHLLDAMTYLPLWAKPPKRMLDVGSGAGFPGIPLAILEPHRHFTLIESTGKKCRFLEHVRDALGAHDGRVQRCPQRPPERVVGLGLQPVVEHRPPARLLAREPAD